MSEEEIDFDKLRTTATKTPKTKGILEGIKKEKLDNGKPKSRAGRKKKNENEKVIKVPLYLTKDELLYITNKKNKELPMLDLSPFMRHKMQELELVCDKKIKE
jgi:hypothetical protein